MGNIKRRRGLEDGSFRSKSDASKSITFKELAGRVNRAGGPVVGRAAISGKQAGPAFALLIVDVEVDPDTGKVDILRATIVQDAGKSHLSRLCRRADAGRCGPGNRMGIERGICVQRPGSNGQRLLPGLSDAHSTRHADD